MRWRMFIGLIWFCMIPAALLFNIVAQRWASRRDREQAVIIRRVDRMLRCWAENWSEPAPVVQAKLLEAIKE